MYKAYVLRDEDGRLYKGMTQNINQRLSDHKRGRTKSTKNFKNIKVVYSEEFPDQQSARNREKYLKTAAGRKFLRDNLQDLVP